MRQSVIVRRSRNSETVPPDLVIIALVIGLIIFGVLMVFDASMVEAYHSIGDQWYFIKNQFKNAAIGIVLGLIAYHFPIKKLEKLALPIIISALFFLLIVLVPGIGSKLQGARRWINLGAFLFQPSEYAKLASIMYLSVWFSKPRPARSFAVLLSCLIGLIMMEPDMGTALVIAGITISMYVISGAPFKKILRLGGFGLIGIVLLIAVAPYRMDRVKTLINPMHDPLGASYHSRQVLISLGSGGFLGTGLGRSRQKFQYLPEASTDSIFAVVGEEFGFVGALILIIAQATIIVRGFNAARKINDTFIANLAAGITSWLAVQIILNLMAMVGLVPLTGIPLPLISYGGSALITMLTGIGLLARATTYRQLDSRLK